MMEDHQESSLVFKYGYLQDICDMVLAMPFMQSEEYTTLKDIIDRAKANKSSGGTDGNEPEVVAAVDAYIQIAHMLLTQGKHAKFKKTMEFIAKSMLMFHTAESYPKSIQIKYTILKLLNESTYDTTRLAIFKETLTKSQGTEGCEIMTGILHMVVSLLHTKTYKEINYNDTKSATLYFLKRMKLETKMSENFRGLDLVYLSKRFGVKYRPYKEIICLSIAICFHMECLLRCQLGAMKDDSIDMAKKSLYYLSNAPESIHRTLQPHFDRLINQLKDLKSRQLDSTDVGIERNRYMVTLNQLKPRAVLKDPTNSQMNVPEKIIDGSKVIMINQFDNAFKRKKTNNSILITNNGQIGLSSDRQIKTKPRSIKQYYGMDQPEYYSSTPQTLKDITPDKNYKPKQTNISKHHLNAVAGGKVRWTVKEVDYMQEETIKDSLSEQRPNTTKKESGRGEAEYNMLGIAKSKSKKSQFPSASNLDDFEFFDLIPDDPNEKLLKRKKSSDNVGKREGVNPYMNSMKNAQSSLGNLINQSGIRIGADYFGDNLNAPYGKVAGELSPSTYGIKMNTTITSKEPKKKLAQVNSVMDDSEVGIEAAQANYFFGQIVSERPSFMMSNRPSGDTTRTTWLMRSTDRNPTASMKQYLINPYGLDEVGSHKRKMKSLDRKLKISKKANERARLDQERWWGWVKKQEHREEESHQVSHATSHIRDKLNFTDRTPMNISKRYLDGTMISDAHVSEHISFEGPLVIEEDEIEELKNIFAQPAANTPGTVIKNNSVRSRQLLAKALRVIQGAKSGNFVHAHHGENSSPGISPFPKNMIIRNNLNLHVKPKEEDDESQAIYSVGSRTNPMTRDMGPVEKSISIPKSKMNSSISMSRRESHRIKRIDSVAESSSMSKKHSVRGKLNQSEIESSVRSKRGTDASKSKIAGQSKSRFGKSAAQNNTKKAPATPTTPKRVLLDSLDDDHHDSASSGSRSKSLSQSPKDRNNLKKSGNGRESQSNKKHPNQTFLDDLNSKIKLRESRLALFISKSLPNLSHLLSKLIIHKQMQAIVLTRLHTTAPNTE